MVMRINGILAFLYKVHLSTFAILATFLHQKYFHTADNASIACHYKACWIALPCMKCSTFQSECPCCAHICTNELIAMGKRRANTSATWMYLVRAFWQHYHNCGWVFVFVRKYLDNVVHYCCEYCCWWLTDDHWEKASHYIMLPPRCAQSIDVFQTTLSE